MLRIMSLSINIPLTEGHVKMEVNVQNLCSNNPDFAGLRSQNAVPVKVEVDLVSGK